jgi:hypothetical protein
MAAASASADPTPATLPSAATGQPASRPEITARLSSKRPRGRSGWWTTPVTVTFTCRTRGGTLAGACPKPVRLSKSGSNLSVQRTISTTSGQKATVTVRRIHIDLTEPHVRIFGPLEWNSYAFTAPRPRCHATDRYSGVRSCTITEQLRVPALGGYKILYGAQAVSGAGTVGKAGLLSFVTTVVIVGGSEITGDYWSVTPGHRYVLQVLSRTRPAYLDAAPRTGSPTGPHDYFSRAGSVDGIPLWKVTLNITKAFARFPNWTVGIQTGTTVRRIKLEMLSGN